MLHSLAQGSPPVIAILASCFVLVLVFEFSNGFHDTANAVATVIYTNALRPHVAVVWSGIMNFIGVIAGGIAVAYALVEIIPPPILTPPDGSLATGMLVAVFASAPVLERRHLVARNSEFEFACPDRFADWRHGRSLDRWRRRILPCRLGAGMGRAGGAAHFAGSRPGSLDRGVRCVEVYRSSPRSLPPAGG